MAGGTNVVQPQLKKSKLDDSVEEFVFTNFKKDIDKLLDLEYAVKALTDGFNRMNFILIKVVDCNARSSVSFTNAASYTIPYEKEIFVAASIFQKGIDVLEQYLLSDKRIKVPAAERQRTALYKLLKFLLEDQDELTVLKNDCEGKEGDSAQNIPQHLLTKLAVDNKYVVAPDSNLALSTGHIGDTSFGCEQGWHGSADILLEEYLPVQFLKDPSLDDSSENSVSANDEDEKQLLAQTIVFSFLQHKYNKNVLKNFLVPAIGISSKNLYINLYDCENDVFLSSDRTLQIFGGDKLVVEVVVLLWLTLNYREFCSGIPEEMTKCKAEFHRRLDDMLPEYMDNVKRPLQVSYKTHTGLNWAALRGRKVERSFEKNEYYEL